MWGVLVAILSGALMSVQGVFNTSVTKQTSIWLTAMFVQISAFVICLLAWFVAERGSRLQDLLQVTPKYMLLGGIIGAFITITVVKGIHALGAARAEMYIVCAQLLVAYFMELLGMFGLEKQEFSWRKLGGIVLFLLGVVLFKWK